MAADPEAEELEQPALLYPFTADWRWTSRGEWEDEIRDLASRLASLPLGIRVGFTWQPRPRALTYDLALRRAGLVSVPVADRLPAPVDRWLGGGAPPDVPELSPEEPTEITPGREGAVLVASSRGVVEWGAAECGAAAGSIRRALGPPKADRPLAFLSGCPLAPGERGFLEWALEDRAALLLAGDAELVGPSFLWSRPTVACLDEERLARVEAALRSVGTLRRLRRRFRRLEVLLLSEPAETSADRELWQALDVRLVSVPTLLP